MSTRNETHLDGDFKYSPRFGRRDAFRNGRLNPECSAARTLRVGRAFWSSRGPFLVPSGNSKSELAGVRYEEEKFVSSADEKDAELQEPRAPRGAADPGGGGGGRRVHGAADAGARLLAQDPRRQRVDPAALLGRQEQGAMRARLPGARSGPDGEGLHRGLHGAALRRHARARPHRPPDAGVGLLRRHHRRQELRRLDAAARGGPLRPRLLRAAAAGVPRPGGPAERQGHHAAAAGHHPRALQLRAHPAGPRRQHRHSERLPAALRRQQGQPLVLPHVPAARRRHQPGPAGGRPDAAAPVGAARRRAVRSHALRLRRRHQRQELRRPDARRRLRRRVRAQQAVPGLPAGRHQTSSEPAGRVSHQDPPVRRPAAAVPPGGASHRQGHEGLSQTQVLTHAAHAGNEREEGGVRGGKTDDSPSPRAGPAGRRLAGVCCRNVNT